jgi:GNAT superfamily N-acetyltransferase
MTRDPVEVRTIEGNLLAESEKTQLVGLLQRALRGWPGPDFDVPPVEYLEWKVRDFPPGAHVIVAEVASRIAGLMVIMRRRWIAKGISRPVRDGVDLAVDPTFQGEGLLTAMRRYAVEHDHPRFDLEFLYRTVPAAIRIKPRVGARAPANPIQVLFKTFSVQRLVAEQSKRGAGRVPAPIVRVGIETLRALNRVRHPPLPPQTASWSVSTIRRFDDRIDTFSRDVSQMFDFVQERTMDYLNWRYCDPRGGRFTVRVTEQNDDILGYAVCKVSGTSGYIADLLALPGRLDVARFLLEDSLRLLGGRGITNVTCWMAARHPYAEVLRRCGFLVSNKKTGAAYRPFLRHSDELEFLSDRRARIHVMLGDSDHI